MNTKLLLAIVTIILINGCSSAHKATQTIDDVYYSPMNGTPAYVATPATNIDIHYNEYSLLSIGDRRWRNYGYANTYNPYYYGFNNDFYFNDYYYNNNYCNYPVYTPIFYSPVSPAIRMPRITNLNAYNTKYNNSNQAIQNRANLGKQQKVNTATNKQSGVSRFFQQLLTPTSDNDNNNNSNNNYNPNGNSNAAANNNSSSNANNTNYDNRNYNPPSSSSSNSSSSGSSGGGGSARRH